jgi:uncharacterized protein (TIGR00290 family)
MSNPVPILLAWSGGKDCLMALQTLRRDPSWEIKALLTTVNRSHQRVAMHGVRRDVLHAQAASLGLPLIEAPIEWPSANAAYEQAQALAFAHARERWPGLRHCAFGDLFLADVRAYREAQLVQLDWQGLFPLWGLDTATLARRFVAEGHRAVLCCVDTEQLAGEYCGQEYDADLLDRLPGSVDACGERGEFHTLSYAGPAFAQPLPITRGESVLRDARFMFTDFLLAEN